MLMNRFPGTCSSDLVEYGFGDDPGYRTLRWALRRNRTCERDAARAGVCWCGKVAMEAFVAANPGLVGARRVLGQEDVRRIAARPEVEP